MDLCHRDLVSKIWRWDSSVVSAFSSGQTEKEEVNRGQKSEVTGVTVIAEKAHLLRQHLPEE